MSVMDTIGDMGVRFKNAPLRKVNTLRAWAKKNKLSVQLTRNGPDNFSGAIVVALRFLPSRDAALALWTEGTALVASLHVQPNRF